MGTYRRTLSDAARLSCSSSLRRSHLIGTSARLRPEGKTVEYLSQVHGHCGSERVQEICTLQNVGKEERMSVERGNECG
jgi:hypothetical protein